MNLELKHLAPYLPYGLKVLHKTYCESGSHKTAIVDVESLHKECATFSDGMDYYFDDPQDNECLIKPILRPLSGLTKEIEHNGERFIPLYKMIKEDKTFTTDFIHDFGYEELKVSVYELLIEYHFDVFGLISQGLAIDVNTLETQP